jgi:hypothetical protein
MDRVSYFIFRETHKRIFKITRKFEVSSCTFFNQYSSSDQLTPLKGNFHSIISNLKMKNKYNIYIYIFKTTKS